MSETIESVASYCRRIQQYIDGKETKPSTLPQSTFSEIRDACHDPSGKPIVQKSKELLQLRTNVDKTKAAVEKEIKSLDGSPNDEDKLFTLHSINSDLYQLHRELHTDNLKKLETTHKKTLTAIPNSTKHAQKGLKAIERSLNLRDKLIRILRVFIIITACLTFVLAFQNPEYVTLMVPYPLISFVFILPALNYWLKSIEDQLEDARETANPLPAKQALEFLKRPEALNNLWVLLDEPSSEGEHQKKYINMLVDLGSATEWIDTKKGHAEAEKDTMLLALEEAYAETPKTFDPDFLKGWLKSFDELQNEVRGHFGKSVKLFCKKSAKNPTYFLTCFRKFTKSKTGQKVKRFLNEL